MATTAATGTWDNRDLISQVEAGLQPGTPVELHLQFPVRFWGFESGADQLADLMQASGVTRWSNGSPYVAAHPTEPIWIVRWTRNPLWAVLIWTLIRTTLVGLAILSLLYLITWKLLIPAVSEATDLLKVALPYLALGGIAILVMRNRAAGKPPGR